MDFTIAASFLLLAVPSFFTPGPNNLMLMTSAARFGLGRTVPHAVGIVLGFPFMVFVIGLGLGEVFAAYPAIKEVLKYVAAAYFLYMAWHLLGLKIGAMRGSDRPLGVTAAALFQWVNPKAWAMAASFVAAFVGAGEGHYQSLFWLTFGCLLLAPLSSLVWMAFGERLQAFLKRTHGERFLGAILALLMLTAVVLFVL